MSEDMPSSRFKGATGRSSAPRGAMVPLTRAVAIHAPTLAQAEALAALIRSHWEGTGK